MKRVQVREMKAYLRAASWVDACTSLLAISDQTKSGVLPLSDNQGAQGVLCRLSSTQGIRGMVTE
jgi:hypothetical protein